MIQDIKYSGYTAQPSDYECQDGDLAASINLVPDNNAIQPLPQPKIVASQSSASQDAHAMFIHQTASYTHYIYLREYTLILTPNVLFSDELGGALSAAGDRGLQAVTRFDAIGNTLLAFSESAIYYLFWDGTAYKYLGDHIPDISISFGLIGRPRQYSTSGDTQSTFNVTAIGFKDPTNIEEPYRTQITEQVMAKVNKFVADQTINKGRFCFPFFVRYAMKLFDGSLVNHSAPILMMPSTKAAPIVWWNTVRASSDNTYAICDMMLVAASLDYKIIDNHELSLLKNWSDIVTGIEVYISKPIYTYDQAGKITSIIEKDNFLTRFVGRLYAENTGTVCNTPTEDRIIGSFKSTDFLDVYAEWEYSHIYGIYFKLDRMYPGECLRLPEFSEGKMEETLKNTSTFYKLHSIPFEKIIASSDRTEIIVDDEYLQSLTTREVMTDDYLTHERLIAGDSYTYNNRLNLSSVRRVPFSGFGPDSMFSYVSHWINWKGISTPLDITTTGILSLMNTTVYIKEDGKTYSVSASGTNATYLSADLKDSFGNVVSKARRSYGCYVFYPNVNAFKMIIRNGVSERYIIDLHPHDFLNGAYGLLDFDIVRETDQTPAPSTSFGDATLLSGLPVPNKVYTYEVNNPFFFPLSGINSIGTGTILGMATAAKALSEGQFGQFPLYAFTTDGVWAMEVSSTGTYSARQPITRDVCINPAGITQIDSAVLFPTDRGIMLISGSDCQCISDTINSDHPFNILSLPGMEKLHAAMGHGIDTCIPTIPFVDFLRSCRMIYDYVHQHIIVYNPSLRYAYVYSLRSKQWGMMHSDIADSLNSYPEALAINTAGQILDFSQNAPDLPPLPQLLVTRPLTIDSPDNLKTIDTAIQRGHFRKGHVMSVLYGSRDLYNWHLVWSSKDHYLRGFRGTPYKYIRIALLCNLTEDESIYGATVQYQTKKTNQPR